MGRFARQLERELSAAAARIAELEELEADVNWWVSIGCPQVHPMRPADDDPDRRPMWFLAKHSSIHYSRDPISAIHAARINK